MFGKLEETETQRINKSGIGLGLAISQTLVKRLNNEVLGGEIAVVSEYGRGSLFHFFLLPYEDPSLSKQASSSLYKSSKYFKANSMSNRDFDEINEEKSDIKSLRGIKVKSSSLDIVLERTETQNLMWTEEQSNEKQKQILFVDDDQINIMVVTSYLNSFSDCKYDLAFNGKQALDMIFDRANEGVFYDIIFMDCNMPIMDGFEATRRILEIVNTKLLPKVPIIASTANATQKDCDFCLKNGMNDYLVKPYGKQSLREKIDKYAK